MGIEIIAFIKFSVGCILFLSEQLLLSTTFCYCVETFNKFFILLVCELFHEVRMSAYYMQFDKELMFLEMHVNFLHSIKCTLTS